MKLRNSVIRYSRSDMELCAINNLPVHLLPNHESRDENTIYYK